MRELTKKQIFIMKKSILSLKGAQELTKNEQKRINGGDDPLYLCRKDNNGNDCPDGMKCKITGYNDQANPPYYYGYCY